MFKKTMCAVGFAGCGLLGFAAVAHAGPLVPPPNVVGMSESEARGVLADDGYKPKVISRNGGGPNCVVFHQSSVTDFAYRQNDDEDVYRVYLAVNCLA
ncbi:PASTA domain-containing protein [Rhodococcus sp. 1168]|uniref:PASTA domain-containing protein n=1 Tax=Rhodococcus sp. 1168 TaxID=2018041 RepID=UPI000F748605|nr:PASTA domain-containing protein [Rhodococcus sp. 1168]